MTALPTVVFMAIDHDGDSSSCALGNATVVSLLLLLTSYASLFAHLLDRGVPVGGARGSCTLQFYKFGCSSGVALFVALQALDMGPCRLDRTPPWSLQPFPVLTVATVVAQLSVLVCTVE